MTPPGDPYRVLGLAPGASLEEVKRAYRRLAKQAHPDASGTAATARFITLQRAYESIVREGRPMLGGRARGTGSRPRPGARPGGRPAPGATGGSTSGSSTSGGSATGGRAPGGRTPGSTGGAGPRPHAGQGERAGRAGVHRPRAGLGTTTYDGADAEMARPPDWEGASWYGVSSGTYWTVNPREYADPRKHGPEYLARGRRVARSGRATPASAGAEQPAATAENVAAAGAPDAHANGANPGANGANPNANGANAHATGARATGAGAAGAGAPAGRATRPEPSPVPPLDPVRRPARRGFLGALAVLLRRS